MTSVAQDCLNARFATFGHGKLDKVPLIVYASRTHSQLTQVIGELRKTAYRPKIGLVSSREQLCTNPSVRGLKNNGAMAAMCGQLVKKNQCAEHGKVGEAATRLEVIRKDVDQILDIEDLMRIAKNHWYICNHHHLL